VTQNWSFEFVKIGGRMVLSRARFWVLFFSLLVWQKSMAEWRNLGSETENITESYFWPQICSNFMRD